MRISLSTLRKIIRESVNESASAPLRLDHYNLHNAIKSAGIHINDMFGGDRLGEGISIHSEGGKLQIMIPDNVAGSKSVDAAELKKQISDLLMSKFNCELVPKREISGFGTLYLVVESDEEQTHPQNRGHYHF